MIPSTAIVEPQRALEVADGAVDHQRRVLRVVEQLDRHRVRRRDVEQLVRIARRDDAGGDSAPRARRQRHAATRGRLALESSLYVVID